MELPARGAVLKALMGPCRGAAPLDGMGTGPLAWGSVAERPGERPALGERACAAWAEERACTVERDAALPPTVATPSKWAWAAWAARYEA